VNNDRTQTVREGGGSEEGGGKERQCVYMRICMGECMRVRKCDREKEIARRRIHVYIYIEIERE